MSSRQLAAPPVTPAARDRAAPNGAPARMLAAAALLVPPLVAFLFGAGLLWLTVAKLGGNIHFAHTWGRWDSGHYVSIAREGYRTVPCTVRNLPPHHPPGPQLCGNLGWFPLYSWLMVVVSATFGLSIGGAGVAVSLACWYLTLLLVWVLLKQTRPTIRVLCLLLAAVFPGQVYYHAVFPVSLFTFLTLALVYLLGRRRTVLAGLVGAGAGASYITGVLLAPAVVGAALVTGAVARRLEWRALGRATVVATGVLAGFLGVMVVMYVKVGIWGAYFASTRKFGVGVHNPVPIFIAKVTPVFDRLAGTPIDPARYGVVHQGVQTLLTALIVVLCVLATLVRRRVTRQDWLLIAITLGFWIFPHTAGLSASQYRSEALVVPVVLLARHLPAPVVALLVAGATWVAWIIAPLFFSGVLK